MNKDDQITLQYEAELVKDGIDFDNPKDVQYLYNWAKNKEKECDKLKESHKELIEVLEHVRKDIVWNEPSPTLNWINKALTKAKQND